jgi:hypothetical protein
VRQKRSIPDKERRLIHVGQKLEERLKSVSPNLESFISMPTSSFRISVGHTMSEASPEITPLPPFSSLITDISCARKQSGKSRCGFNSTYQTLVLPEILGITAFYPGGSGRIIARNAILVRIKTSDHRSQAGPAEAGRHVAITIDKTL